MKRRSFACNSTLAVGAALLPINSLTTLYPMPEMIMLRQQVGYFKERGGTIGWLNHPEGIVVVDSQWKEQADYLIGKLLDGTFRPIDFLINTHHHGDHTSGNIAFKGIANHVLAHENSKQNQINHATAKNIEAEQLYPDLIYTDRWQQQVGKEFIDIQYWGAAHTNGDSIIHFQHANIAHIGDLVFNRRYPYIDKVAGADITNWINILGRLQTYFDQDTIFIFGHAADTYRVTGDKDDIAAFADYLTALLEFVDAKIKSGASRDEIMSTTAIPGAPDWKGEGIERSLSAAYEELIAQ